MLNENDESRDVEEKPDTIKGLWEEKLKIIRKKLINFM